MADASKTNDLKFINTFQKDLERNAASGKKTGTESMSSFVKDIDTIGKGRYRNTPLERHGAETKGSYQHLLLPPLLPLPPLPSKATEQHQTQMSLRLTQILPPKLDMATKSARTPSPGHLISTFRAPCAVAATRTGAMAVPRLTTRTKRTRINQSELQGPRGLRNADERRRMPADAGRVLSLLVLRDLRPASTFS